MLFLSAAVFVSEMQIFVWLVLLFLFLGKYP